MVRPARLQSEKGLGENVASGAYFKLGAHTPAKPHFYVGMIQTRLEDRHRSFHQSAEADRSTHHDDSVTFFFQ
jgi:hypothetical protein